MKMLHAMMPQSLVFLRRILPQGHRELRFFIIFITLSLCALWLSLFGCGRKPRYEEALINIEVISQEWIDTAQELGRPIPEPKKGKLMFA